MAEDRDRKVVVLAERKIAPPLNLPPVPRRGHARTESELAYLQETNIPIKPEVADPTPNRLAPVKKGVRISEEDNTVSHVSASLTSCRRRP